MLRDHGKPSVTIFWVHENSWELTLISSYVHKHVINPYSTNNEIPPHNQHLQQLTWLDNVFNI